MRVKEDNCGRGSHRDHSVEKLSKENNTIAQTGAAQANVKTESVDSSLTSRHGISSENGSIPNKETSHVNGSQDAGIQSLSQTTTRNAADVNQEHSTHSCKSRGPTHEDNKSVQTSRISRSQDSMAAPDLSTVPGVATFKTVSQDQAPLMSSFTLQQSLSHVGRSSDAATSSSHMLADPNSLQFLQGIRQRLDRKGNHSDSLPSLGQTGKKTGHFTAQRARVNEGQTGKESARRSASTSDAPGDIGGTNSSSRTRSNFLANLYSQRESTKPKPIEDVGLHQESGKDKDFDGNHNTNNSFNRFSELANQGSFSSSSFPNNDTSRMIGSYPGDPNNEASSPRNVLTPRGVTNDTSPFSTNLASTRSLGSELQNKQVRFIDEETPTSSNVTLISSPDRIRSESTQTNKSALLRHSSKPLNDIADISSKSNKKQNSSLFSIASSSVSGVSDNNNQHKGNYSLKSSSDPDFNLKTGFPMTSPRRHSSSDVFNFSKLSGGDTGPICPNTAITGASSTSPGPASPRLGVSSIRTMPSEAALRTAMRTRQEVPLTSRSSVAPLTSGTSDIHLPRPSSPQTSLVSSSIRSSSPRNGESRLCIYRKL